MATTNHNLWVSSTTAGTTSLTAEDVRQARDLLMSGEIASYRGMTITSTQLSDGRIYWSQLSDPDLGATTNWGEVDARLVNSIDVVRDPNYPGNKKRPSVNLKNDKPRDWCKL